MSETDLPFHNGQFAKLYNYELAIESDAVICTVPLWRHSDRIFDQRTVVKIAVVEKVDR